MCIKNSELLSKHCNLCDQTLSIDMFAKIVRKKKRKDGTMHQWESRYPVCMDCKKAKDRERIKKMLSTEEGRLINMKRCKTYAHSDKNKERKLLLGSNTEIEFIECVDCGKTYCISAKHLITKTHAEKCGECRKKAIKKDYAKRNYKGWTESKKEAHRLRYIQECIDRGPSKCECCSKEYLRYEEGANHKTCSIKCREKRRKLIKKARKRFRKKNSEYFRSTYNPIMVFNRDKWKCQLCGCKVQKKNIYIDNAAEVDHVVPLSVGGVDEYWNVQTACRSCNGKKSNKIIGQLSIFHQSVQSM